MHNYNTDILNVHFLFFFIFFIFIIFEITKTRITTLRDCLHGDRKTFLKKDRNKQNEGKEEKWKEINYYHRLHLLEHTLNAKPCYKKS